MGVDLLVMDDGWFGKRNDDNSSLGDWYVNENKIKCGLHQLVDQIHKLGMKFGIWFEPEMVSEDSDLYRAHPEWTMQIPGRHAVRSRNQMVLDMSRRDVQDYLIEKINAVLNSADIFYVKWDINRSLTDIWSNELPAEKQGEVYHRYILGLYRVMDGIIKTHPDILFEGCSGGGGRYDPAMLHYYPQYWVSDNNHPIDRLKLHYGTSFVYPVSTMGAHISDSGRLVPLKTKAVVAMCGTFGYELDATHLSVEDQELCREQSELFRKYYHIIFDGDYYRLTNPFAPGNMTAWIFLAFHQRQPFRVTDPHFIHGCLKDVIDRYPVFSGRFHADMMAVILQEPVPQVFQICTKGREPFFYRIDRSLIAGAFDHSDDKGFMDIKSTGNRKNSLSYMVHGCSPF